MEEGDLAALFSQYEEHLSLEGEKKIKKIKLYIIFFLGSFSFFKGVSTQNLTKIKCVTYGVHELNDFGEPKQPGHINHLKGGKKNKNKNKKNHARDPSI